MDRGTIQEHDGRPGVKGGALRKGVWWDIFEHDNGPDVKDKWWRNWAR
jgi:hypothetical protein